MPVIVVTSRDYVQTYVLEEGRPLFLGRAAECDVVLPASAVSRRHAVILCKNGVCGVKDLGSFNGTIVNDKVIQEPHQLSDNDVLRISNYIIRLYTKDPSLAAIETPAAPPTVAGPTPRTVHVDSQRFGKSGLTLPRAMQQTLGRVPESTGPRNTKTFTPGRETARFLSKALKRPGSKTKGPAVPKSGEQDGIYFTPFPVQDGMAKEDKADAPKPVPASVPDESVLADFQESPLAQLDDIGSIEEKPPTPFLASSENFDAAAELVAVISTDAESVIPLQEEESSEISVEAEAIIPLLDEAPLVTTIQRELLNDDDAEEAAEQDVEFVPPSAPSSDTAQYTLPAGPPETDTGFETDKYLVTDIAEKTPADGVAPVIPDDVGPAITQKAPITSEVAPVADEPEEGDEAEEPEEDDFGGRTKKRSWRSRLSSRTEKRQRIVANIGGVDASQTSIKGKSSLAGIASITISPALMAAINTRLSLYSLLYDLVEERKRFRGQHPDLPEDVEAELDRQDHELDDLPTAEDADRQLQALKERNEQLAQAVEHAREAGLPAPPEPTAEMYAVEDFAVSQWMVIADSNREALPAIYKEAYTLAADEPLVKEFNNARIAHGRLMGGGIYLLALESLATMANKNRFRIAQKIRALQEGDDEDDGIFGKIGKIASNFANRAQVREEIARLEQEDRMNAIRADLATRESAFIEKTLAREFRQVYKKTALRFIPEFDAMPIPIRAFLRHGALGMRTWWMTKDAREYIIRDCSENIVSEFTRGTGDIPVLYADEYLYFVSQMDCTPSPDEELLAGTLNTNEWKTDRAYRRIVNARSYNVLMEEMLNQLDITGKYLHDQAVAIEKRIEAVKERGYPGGGNIFDMQAELQTAQSRQEGIERNSKRIKDELVPSILEAIEDAERRFRQGDLKIPDQETLIRREVDAMFQIGQRMEGNRERFIPMAVREQYRFKSETVNDRGAVRSLLVKMEEFDPNIFMRTIIPSKHKRNRVDLRMSPTVIILPAAGQSCCCSMGREGMESGHLVVPTCFVRQGVRTRHITHMLADFRWDTSRAAAGRDVAKSDTLAGAFTKLRWSARQMPRNRREKQMIFTDIPEKDNWRRIYEVYLPDALNGGRLLFQRNPDLYESIIGKYIDPPEGVRILRRGTSK